MLHKLLEVKQPAKQPTNSPPSERTLPRYSKWLQNAQVAHEKYYNGIIKSDTFPRVGSTIWGYKNALIRETPKIL